MISNVLQQIYEFWNRLSPRERRLAQLTGIALVIMIGFTAYQRAMNHLRVLDLTINQLEDDLVSYTFQIAHRELVESKYAKIAAQHSSLWTEAEIYDRLRQEIYRLARLNPPPLDENGIPIATGEEGGNLVEIPSLGKGNMAEGGRGYREYRINLRIPPCPLNNLMTFLERLQQSPQSLRIDALELNRVPDSTMVSASIDITRIVADGPAAAAKAETSSAPSALGRIFLKADEWVSRGASIKNVPTQSAHGSLEVQLQEESAEIALTRQLQNGTPYEVIIDIAANQGEVKVTAMLESSTQVLAAEQRVEPGGSMQRLYIHFSLPGDRGSSALVKCPLILVQGKSAVIQIANVLIREAPEV